MSIFSNHFLISMPHMTDPMFNKSLIFVCEHDGEGAMGLIINKPLPSANVGEILSQTRLDQLSPIPDIYFGGPVSMNQGFFLHSKNYEIEGSHPVSEQISLTSNIEIIDDIIKGKGPNNFRFVMGYAGWGKQQLDREFENGDWLTIPSSPDFIFQMPDHLKWENAAKTFGIDIMDISGRTGFS